MSELQDQTVPLKPGQIAFLAEVAKTFNLDDPAKVLRCLVNYAREHPDRHDDIFGEVRCLDC